MNTFGKKIQTNFENQILKKKKKVNLEDDYD